MRFGCFGCLFLIVALLVVAVVGLGILFLSSNIFSTPEVRTVGYGRSDGFAAQQKLFEIVQRQAGHSSRRDPVRISEAEANGFLSRHLEQSGLPLSPMAVRFTRGQLTVQGRTPLRNLLKSPPLALIASHVPDRRLDEPVWVTVRGRIRVTGGRGHDSRRGELEVDDFILGTQPLGQFLPTLLLGPSGGGLLSWPLPSNIDNIEIADGHLTITTR
jgi:hypothetical protein